MRNIKCAIYKIENIITKDCYIGSSTQINRRLKEHKTNLFKNKHSNNYLQKAWNKYGEDNFTFEIIKDLKELSELNKNEQLKNLFKIEQYYIDNLNSKYNLNKKAGFGYSEKKNRKSIKIYQYDLSGNLLKEWNNFSDIEKHYNKKLNHIYNCLNSKRKIAYDFQWSYLNNQSTKVNKGKKEVLLYDGDILIKEYKSLAASAKDFNKSYVTIRDYCNGKHSPKRTFKNNFIFKYK